MDGDAKFRFCVDLHVHTRRYSPCAEALDPRQLGNVMAQCGLHGLVIAEHDQLWPAEDIAAMNRRLNGRRIYRGVEVSSKNGHFVVIGLDGLDGIQPGIDIAALISRIQDQGAAIIWAHPRLRYESTPAPISGSQMPCGLNAVEVASGVTGGRNTRAIRALARKMGWAAVGGSDAHAPGQVGCAFTLFKVLPKDEKMLAAVIRKGECMARHRRIRAGR